VSNVTKVLYLIKGGVNTVVRVGVIKAIVTVFDFKNKKYLKKLIFQENQNQNLHSSLKRRMSSIPMSLLALPLSDRLAENSSYN
jgi:hypothetical protein